ncbi:MAG TPA: hypothetical protein PKM12_10100, partial [Marmoricola sp.]|nr:hypothetical protein [Marmoricola sp.]
TSEGVFSPDFADEIVAGCAVTYGGEIVHQPTREAIQGPDPVAPAQVDDRDQVFDQEQAAAPNEKEAGQ